MAQSMPRKPKKERLPFWKSEKLPPEVRSLFSHIGKAADNMTHSQWSELIMNGGLAALSAYALAPTVREATYEIYGETKTIVETGGLSLEQQHQRNLILQRLNQLYNVDSRQPELYAEKMELAQALRTLMLSVQKTVSYTTNREIKRLTDEEVHALRDQGINVAELEFPGPSFRKVFDWSVVPNAFYGPLALRLATTMGGTPPVSQMAGLAGLAIIGLNVAYPDVMKDIVQQLTHPEAKGIVLGAPLIFKVFP